MARWVFYSSKTGNTARLLKNAGLNGHRIPNALDEAMPEIHEPFILLTPSFGDATGKGAVPKAVIRFLNAPERRQWIR
ncbi:MAG: class Ib ribonucleoside-diphosphate reductase assembly flavoprotein NrdI, partial [Comamonas sp.]